LRPGTLYGVGVGPGDPKLVTVKAQEAIAAATAVAYLAKEGERGRAREAADPWIPAAKEELRFTYPTTTGPAPDGYRPTLDRFYDRVAAQLAARLERGESIALLCEGDPLLYGSYIYIHNRLKDRFPTEVVPGVCSFSAAAAAAGLPLASGEEVFAVIPATVDRERLTRLLGEVDGAAVIKLGRTFPAARAALAAAGRLEEATYVERASLPRQRLLPAAAVEPQTVPYMSLLLAPAARSAPATNRRPKGGELAIVGLGPGDPCWLTAEARAVLAEAQELVGYAPYLSRLAPLPGQRLHPSDNREELERARLAVSLAGEGRRVAVVSSGDPGVFAMAAAVVEVLEEEGLPEGVRLRVVPGVSAMQAAAARVGAPLGHDFCAISLSDNLKPWEVVERRLLHAARADLVIALYNPASRERREGLEKAHALLLRERDPATPTVFARALGSAEEEVRILPLAQLPLEEVDMRTLLIVGSSRTRAVANPAGKPLIYTPRSYLPLVLPSSSR